MQQEFQYCVIDEVDSILIDEARAPLIISGQVERPQEKYQQAAEVANHWHERQSWARTASIPRAITRWMRSSAAPSPMKAAKAEQMLGVADLFNPKTPGPTTSPTLSKPRSCS